MRTTDPDPTPFRPLGEKVTKPAPAPASSSPAPRGPSGLVTDADGRIRTTEHKPRFA